MIKTFNAIQAAEQTDGSYKLSIIERQIEDLPENDVLIKVLFSGLNYKDALSASGNKGITKKYPHTPGIDAAGVVIESKDQSFKEGEEVLVTGYDLGMNTSGGFGEYIRVPGTWIVKRPKNLSLKECMIIGTSGFTAASGILEFIQHGVSPVSGEILVTGATGAVGSIAINMLATAGYKVCASSGKESATEFLTNLGASRIIDRVQSDDTTGKPLLPGTWAAVLDTVGGNILSTAIRSTKERGIITTCGMITSNTLNVSIFPFILRAVRLIGIASADTPMQKRLQIWELIESKLKPTALSNLARTVTLNEVPYEIELTLKGKQQGKVVVELG